MLNHVDSPYIRCIGFLYLRYGSNPTEIWDRFYPFLYDEDPVRTSAKILQPEITVGEFVRSLLNNMDYFGTLLPRLPLAIEREIKVKLLQAEKVEERALKHFNDKKSMLYFEKVGSHIQALYGDEENPIKWYEAVVDRVVRKDDETGVELTKPKFLVTFPQYGNTELVSLGEIDMPQGQYSGNTSQDRPRFYDDNRHHTQSEKHDFAGPYHRQGNNEHNNGYTGKFNSRCDDDRYEYDRKFKLNKDRRNDYHHDRYRHNRSRDHHALPPSSKASCMYSNEEDLMEEVLRRERESSTATGRAYAARPVSFKESCATNNNLGQQNSFFSNHQSFQRNRNQEDNNKRRAHCDSGKDTKQNISQPKRKTAEELAVISEKKRKLLARYG